MLGITYAHDREFPRTPTSSTAAHFGCPVQAPAPVFLGKPASQQIFGGGHFHKRPAGFDLAGIHVPDQLAGHAFDKFPDLVTEGFFFLGK